MSSFLLIGFPLGVLNAVPFAKDVVFTMVRVARSIAVGSLELLTSLFQGLLWTYTQPWPWFTWPFIYLFTFVALLPAYFIIWMSYLLDFPLPTLYLPLSPAKVLQVAIYQLHGMKSSIRGQRQWSWINTPTENSSPASRCESSKKLTRR